MLSRKLQGLGSVVVVSIALVGATGCKKKHRGSTDLAQHVQQVVASPQLAILQWVNYSDYQAQVKQFYDARDYALAWTENGEPTAQAHTLIDDFVNATAKGLRPDDYDAARWTQRMDRLHAIQKSHDSSEGAQNVVAEFDAAVTISAMRYISDLHSGRVNPQHLTFDIDVPAKRAAFDLPAFLNDQVAEAGDPNAAIATVEPQNPMYTATEKALQQYIALAKEQTAARATVLNGVMSPTAALLPAVASTVSVGQPYPAAALYVLESHLAMEGDWAGAAPQQGNESTYTQEASDAVMRYQARHGLTPDGKLTGATVASINVPMTMRVEQLNLSLERWRWLAEPYQNPRLLENLAEFVVRAYNPDHSLAFKMKTVNGQFQRAGTKRRCSRG